jgi:ABC-2 type transport system permease protein
MLIVGGGDLFVFDKGILILSQGDALQRFLLAYLIATWVQMTVAALAFMFSTWTNNSVGPIIGTYAVIVVSMILTVIKIPALEVIHPYLFVSYFDVFLCRQRPGSVE